MQELRNIVASKMDFKSWSFDPLMLRRAALNALAEQRAHVILWCPVFMAFGIILYFVQSFEPSFTLAFAAVMLPIIACVFAWEDERFRVPLIFLLCFGVGFFSAKIRTEQVYTPILQKEMGPVSVHGRVYAVEHLAASGGERVVLENVSIEDLELQRTPDKVRIKFRGEQGLKVGQHIEVLAGLNPPSAPVIPGGFDFQRFMFFKNIGAVGFAYGAPSDIQPSQESSVYRWFQDLRSRIVTQLSDRLGEPGAVAGALMVGHKAGISEEDRDAMRHAGLAHMLAISGLHIGLFFGAVFFTARLFMAGIPALALQYPVKKYAAIVAMAAAVFYMVIAGATIPTQRAVLMTGVVFIAILLNRTPLTMRLVSFAALVILLIAPESLLSASFQMSFSAVAALVGFYTAIRPYWSAIHRQAGVMRRAGLYVLGVSMTTIIATFATAPFAMFHFQQLAVYSLLSNIVAMPVLGFVVMPFAVLYFALLPFGLEGLTVPFIGWGIEVILDIAHYVAGLEFAVAHSVMWPASALAFFASGFVMVLLVKGKAKALAFIPLTLFFVTIFITPKPDILVSSTAALVAVKDDNGHLHFSGLRKERFVREQWMQAYGLEGEAPEKWPREGEQKPLLCGEGACRFERAGHKVSIIRELASTSEECAWADIVIAGEPLKDCAAGHVIDRFAVYRSGAQAIYLEDGAPRIFKADALRGERPWVAQAQ
ncbi:MAG: ComEC/Rec2 family competence protein [Pseudomonadota bacterium]